MSGEFYVVLTDPMLARIAAFAAGGAPVDLTHFACGDGNGQAVSPTQAQSTLVRQIWPAVGLGALDSVVVNPIDSQELIVTFALPSTAGPFTVREIGFYDAAGVLMAIAKTELVKHAPSSGQYEEDLCHLAIKVGNTASITIVGSDALLATRAYVDAKFNLVGEPFATIVEHLAGALETKKTHPKGVKAMIDAALTWFADQLPLFATTPEHLSGLLNSRWCHPAGVKAMIAEALGMSADLPLSWNAATRKMTLRPATNAETGFGRVATDTEASSGVTNALAGYQAPWVKPEQMAAKFAAYVPSQPAVMGIGFVTSVVSSSGTLALDSLIAGPSLTRNNSPPSATLPANTMWRVEGYVGSYVDGVWYGEGVSGGTTNYIYMVRRVS